MLWSAFFPQNKKVRTKRLTTCLYKPRYAMLVIRSPRRHRYGNREFKVYDATVTKTSLKIASSSLWIFFVIASVCLTVESRWNYPGTEFRGAVSKLGKKIQLAAQNLRNGHFTRQICQEREKIKKGRKGNAKLLFLFIKYAKFVALSLLSRRRS